MTTSYASQKGMVFNAHLGFFSQPVYYGDNQVLKSYSLQVTRPEAVALNNTHNHFIENLRSMGIRVPETCGRVVFRHGSFSFDIIQEKFSPDELAGEIIKRGSREDVCGVVKRVVGDGVTFLTSGLCGKMGFHPTLRNYAFRDGNGFYIDTFPPYTDEKSTLDLMRKAAPNRIAKFVMSIISPWMGAYTAEYYYPAPMIGGIVGTSCRLRPELEGEIKESAISTLDSVQTSWKEEVLRFIDKPVRRSFKWTFAHGFYNNQI